MRLNVVFWCTKKDRLARLREGRSKLNRQCPFNVTGLCMALRAIGLLYVGPATLCNGAKKGNEMRLDILSLLFYLYSSRDAVYVLLAPTRALVVAPLPLFHITSSRSSKSLYNLLKLLKNLEHSYLRDTCQVKYKYWLMLIDMLTERDWWWLMLIDADDAE